MKTFTFNTRVMDPHSKEWKERKVQIVEFIKEIKPLFFTTQELRNGTLKDIYDEIKEDFEYTGEERERNGEYVAIFYNKHLLKLLSTETKWLSETPNVKYSKSYNSACVRIVTIATFDDGKHKFRVLSTHLDHVSMLAKIKGAEYITNRANELNKVEPLPTFIMGDMNSTIHEEPIKIFEKSYNSLNKYIEKDNYGETYNNFSIYDRCENIDPIDHIFVSDEIEIHKVYIDRRRNGKIFMSDHYPLILDFDFRK